MSEMCVHVQNALFTRKKWFRWSPFEGKPGGATVNFRIELQVTIAKEIQSLVLWIHLFCYLTEG